MSGNEKKDMPPFVTPAGAPYASVSEFKTISTFVIIFGVLVTIGFGLLVGYAKYDAVYSTYYGYWINSASYFSGYAAGIALFVIGAIASFILGIILLAKRWGPELAQEKGYIIAYGVITLLCAFLFVGALMAIVMLVKLSSNNSYSSTPPPLSVSPPVSSNPPQGNG